jgi:hypothetical protein
MPTVTNPNHSFLHEPSAVNVPVSNVSVNTTGDIAPLLISTDHNNQKLTDIPLTPNTVLTSLGNLSKYANTDNIETIGIHSVSSNEADRHHNIPEGSVQNLEMSNVVYMGDNSYSVHFQTQGKPNQTNLSTETLGVNFQEVGLNQLVDNGVTTNSHVMEGDVRIENQMVEAGASLRSVEAGASVRSEEEVQESQVVEQLHQAYLRTQQSKEKQLQHKAKPKQTTVDKAKQTTVDKAKQTTVERSPAESKQKHIRSKYCVKLD